MQVMPIAPSGTSSLAESLERLALDRDPAAWGSVLALVGPMVSALAWRITGDPILAEDAVQETLLMVRDCAGRFRPRGQDPDADARSWLLCLAAYVSMNLARSQRRARTRRQLPAPPQPGPGHHLDQQETAALIRDALWELPERQRLPIIMHHWSGLTFEHIAATLAVPIGTVKVRAHRGMQQLRRRLQAVQLDSAETWSVMLAPTAPLIPRGPEVPAHEALWTSPRRASQTYPLGPRSTAAGAKAARLIAAATLAGLLWMAADALGYPPTPSRGHGGDTSRISPPPSERDVLMPAALAHGSSPSGAESRDPDERDGLVQIAALKLSNTGPLGLTTTVEVVAYGDRAGHHLASWRHDPEQSLATVVTLAEQAASVEQIMHQLSTLRAIPIHAQSPEIATTIVPAVSIMRQPLSRVLDQVCGMSGLCWWMTTDGILIDRSPRMPVAAN